MKDGGKDLKKAGFLFLSVLKYHTLATLQEVLLGLFLGLGTAITTGYFLAKSSAVVRVLSHYNQGHSGSDRSGGGRICRRGQGDWFSGQSGRGPYNTSLEFVPVFFTGATGSEPLRICRFS